MSPRLCCTCDQELKESERLWCDDCMAYAMLVEKQNQKPLDQEFLAAAMRVAANFKPPNIAKPLLGLTAPGLFLQKEAKA
jgi:predicted amidophosphoribosyltransferase